MSRIFIHDSGVRPFSARYRAALIGLFPFSAAFAKFWRARLMRRRHFSPGDNPVMKNLLLASVTATCLAGFSGSAFAGVFVDAKDDIFLAGMASVPLFPLAQTQTAVPGNGAGLSPLAVPVTGGATLHLTASGIASCGIGCNPSGPAGNPQFGTSAIAAYGNVGAYTGSPGEGFQLLGVFNSGATPWTPFIIGAGGTFTVPLGATELYMGMPDGFSFQGPPGTYN